MSKLPERRSRGEGATEMAVRFLARQLTEDGMTALSVELDRRLAVPGSHGANLAEVRDLIGDNLRWLADGSEIPRLPASIAGTMRRRGTA